MKTRFLAGLGVVATAMLAGCAGGSMSSPSPAFEAGGAVAGPEAPPPAVSIAPSEPAKKAEASAERPGLGTEWGETRVSRIDTVSFQRGDASTPFAMSGLFYNDEQGARAMASSAGFRRTAAGTIPMATGAITVGLRDEGGRFLSGYTASGKNFVVGESGQRYTIILHNNTDVRVEAVVSVDGLDVMDGKEGALRKRGYILDPRADLEIDGFRQSSETVAAFRFGSVRNSYAEKKHGDSRNVGVIGVALFHERGTNPSVFLNGGDIRTRERANPFPGSFATAP